MKSQTTKTYKKKLIITSLISWIFCFGTTATILIFMLAGKEDGESLRERLGSYVYGFIMTNIPLVVLALIVKDRIKPVCWTFNVIFGNITFGGVAIYIIFALWLFDTYILSYMKELYKDRYRINKEIDRRE